MALPTHLICGQQPAEAVSAISAALRSGDTGQALTLAHKALSVHPGDCPVLSLEALAYTAQNKTGLALDAFETALRHCPRYLPALEGAAQIEFAHKSPDAVSHLTRVLEVEPGNVPAQGMLASTLASTGRCQEALPHFVASESLFPSTPSLTQAYANCLAQTGDLLSALQRYQALAADHPSDASHYNIALLQAKLNQPKEALATLDPLLAARQFEPALALGSRVAEQLGDTPRSVELLRAAIVLAPDQADNYLDFASIAFAHSSFQVGIDMLNAGLQRLPEAAPLYLARGVLEVQISKQDEAVADFKRAHQLDPKLSLSEDAVGIMQTQQHKSQAALTSFREEVAQHPRDPLLQYLLAEQLAEYGSGTDEDLQAAIAAARQSTLLDPTYQPARDFLAKLYLRAKQPKLAMEQAELALKQDPDDQDALYQEMMAKRRAGGSPQELAALVAKLKRVRQANAQKQDAVDRYRLVENTPQVPSRDAP